MPHKKLQRGTKFLLAILLLVLFWTAGFFLIKSFEKNLEYYLTPSEVLNSTSREKKIRIGGLIVKGSVEKQDEFTIFTITDFDREIVITYTGNDLPPIFKEGMGVIARGYLIDENHFSAEQLIGKHDENYKPPGLKKS